MKKLEIKKLSIEERIVESGLFSFDDGYLGSTGHGSCYYDNSLKNISCIKDENDLECLVLNEEFGGDIFDEDEFDQLLKELVAGSILYELKEKGYVNSYSDEDTEEMFFLTKEGKEQLKDDNTQSRSNNLLKDLDDSL